MTSNTYARVLSFIIGGFVVLGIVLGFFLFPNLPPVTWLVIAAAGIIVLLAVDRLVLQKRVDEPLGDERTASIFEKTAAITFRIVLFVEMIAVPVLVCVPFGDERLRFIGIGVALALASQGLVFGIAHIVTTRRS